MKVLNLLSTGGIGGIEVLCKDLNDLDRERINTFCFLFGGGTMMEEMCDGGANIINLSNKGKKLSFEKLSELIRIAKDYDIIVAHHGSLLMHFYFLIIAIMLPKKKKVLFHHSCFEKEVYYNGSLLTKLARKTILWLIVQLTDRIIYVSKAGKTSFLGAVHAKADKKRVVYNGISEELIRKGQSNIPKYDGEIRLLYIGRLAKVKGVHLLLEAVASLKSYYRVSLRVVGTGAEYEALRRLAGELGIEDCVSFMGQNRDNDQFYREANCFVYPSTWQEVFGISIVEAMAYGLPCVANKVGGIPEIIQTNENGFLTNEPTAAGIAEAIRRCFEKDNHDTIIAAAHDTAKSFSIRRTSSQLNAIYAELVSGR